MDVRITVPQGTDMAVVFAEYPDMDVTEDGYDEDERYYVGNSSDEGVEDGDEEWLSPDEAVACCGFVEGAIAEAETFLEGNGGWAQGMLRRRDFSTFATTDAQKAEWKRRSNVWWAAYGRGWMAAHRKDGDDE